MGITPADAALRLALMTAASSDPALDSTALTELLAIGSLPYTVPRTDLQYLQSDQLQPTTQANYLYIEVWLPDHQVYLAPDSLASWTANTVYPAGTVIVPSVRNKFRYKTTAGGTSGGVEPVWPVNTDASVTVSDGTVTWFPFGLSWMPTYDLNSAAAEGWRWKAARAASRAQISEMGTGINVQQVFDHCMAMAKFYQAKSIRTVIIPPRHPRSNQDLNTERESIYGWETEGRQWR